MKFEIRVGEIAGGVSQEVDNLRRLLMKSEARERDLCRKLAKEESLSIRLYPEPLHDYGSHCVALTIRFFPDDFYSQFRLNSDGSCISYYQHVACDVYNKVLKCLTDYHDEKARL